MGKDLIQNSHHGKDFPGGSVVQTSTFNAGVRVSQIPDQGAKIPHALPPKTKTENKNNIVTNSIKTITLFHIQKQTNKFKKWKQNEQQKKSNQTKQNIEE